MDDNEIIGLARRAAIEHGYRTPSAQQEFIEAYMETYRASRLRERARCKAICTSAEAVGREALAMTLACTTDYPVERVLHILQSAPLAGGLTEDVFAQNVASFARAAQNAQNKRGCPQ